MAKKEATHYAECSCGARYTAYSYQAARGWKFGHEMVGHLVRIESAALAKTSSAEGR